MRKQLVGFSLIFLSIMIAFLWISPVGFAATDPAQIQIFDVSKGKVVRELESTKTVQEEILKSLESIDGIVPKIHIHPRDGFVVRIPVTPEITVTNEWFDDTVKEVFMIIPHEEKPSMLVFTLDKKPIVMTFEHDLTALLTEIDLKIID